MPSGNHRLSEETEGKSGGNWGFCLILALLLVVLAASTGLLDSAKDKIGPAASGFTESHDPPPSETPPVATSTTPAATPTATVPTPVVDPGPTETTPKEVPVGDSTSPDEVVPEGKKRFATVPEAFEIRPLLQEKLREHIGKKVYFGPKNARERNWQVRKNKREGKAPRLTFCLPTSCDKKSKCVYTYWVKRIKTDEKDEKGNLDSLLAYWDNAIYKDPLDCKAAPENFVVRIRE